MADEKSRQICCCGAKPCAIIIAFIDLLFSVYFLLNSLKFIFDNKNEPPIQQCYEKNPGINSPLLVFFVLSLLTVALLDFKSNPNASLVGSFVAFTLCIVLLVGIYKKKPVCLLVWLVVNGIAVGVIIFTIFVAFLFLGAAALVLLIMLALPLAFEIFGIWIVSEYREDMIDQLWSRNANSPLEFQSV